MKRLFGSYVKKKRANTTFTVNGSSASCFQKKGNFANERCLLESIEIDHFVITVIQIACYVPSLYNVQPVALIVLLK